MQTTLLEQFNNMDRMPIIEVNLKDYNLSDEDEWTYYTLQADEKGIYTICEGGLLVTEWDEDCSLDLHIESLYYDIMSDLSK